MQALKLGGWERLQPHGGGYFGNTVSVLMKLGLDSRLSHCRAPGSTQSFAILFSRSSDPSTQPPLHRGKR